METDRSVSNVHLLINYFTQMYDVYSLTYKRLTYENARLTTDGVLLYKELQGIYNDEYLNFCIDIGEKEEQLLKRNKMLFSLFSHYK